jgi:pyruvate/2-oxoglutarate dehydrogenase complex dihydrolipoamide dehydrogenase (E3) component
MLILHFLMQQNTAYIQQVAHRVRHPYKAAAAGAQAASSSSSNGKQSDSTTATTNNHDDGMELDDVPPMCMSKLVCIKSDSNRVVGFHFVGPNAGELTQGFALALRLGAKKADFDKLVGIHPTDAESFCDLSVTRASGENFVAAAGCGGGSCG